MKNIFISMAICLFLQACQSSSTKSISEADSADTKIDEATLAWMSKVYPGWVNLHKNSPDLASVSFIYDGSVENGHVGRHPPGVKYIFFDGRINQVEHNPEGAVTADFWWEISFKSKSWENYDYSLGNDPSFEYHEDPRERRKRLMDQN